MEYKRHQKLLAHYKAVLKDEPAFQARSLCCLSIRKISIRQSRPGVHFVLGGTLLPKSVGKRSFLD